MNTSKEDTEKINADGAVEIKVDTVDYRTGADPDGTVEPQKQDVEVTHVIQKEDDDDKPIHTDVFKEAAGVAADKLQSTGNNADCAVETKVDTVDYRTGADPGGTVEPKKEDVEVTHVIQEEEDDKPYHTNVFKEAAGVAADKLQPK